MALSGRGGNIVLSVRWRGERQTAEARRSPPPAPHSRVVASCAASTAEPACVWRPLAASYQPAFVCTHHLFVVRRSPLSDTVREPFLVRLCDSITHALAGFTLVRFISVFPPRACFRCDSFPPAGTADQHCCCVNHYTLRNVWIIVLAL